MPDDATEGRTERALGLVAERKGELGDAARFVAEGVARQAHAPLDEVVERGLAHGALELRSEGRARHPGERGELLHLPPPRHVPVNRAQGSFDAFVTEAAKPARGTRPGPLAVGAQGKREQELGETVARDTERGEAAARALAADGDVRFLALDVTSAESVHEAAALLSRSVDTLDVLVNNAGIYLKELDGVASKVALEGVRQTYEVNVFGPLRVTQALDALLRAAPAARVVMISSGLGSLAWQLDPARGLARWPTFAYSSSKTALNALTVALANEYRETAIKVNAVNPGFIATDLNGHTGTTTPEEGARFVVQAATFGDDGPSGGFLDVEGEIPW